jgi:hypothetical protein
MSKHHIFNDYSIEISTLTNGHFCWWTNTGTVANSNCKEKTLTKKSLITKNFALCALSCRRVLVHLRNHVRYWRFSIVRDYGVVACFVSGSLFIVVEGGRVEWEVEDVTYLVAYSVTYFILLIC